MAAESRGTDHSVEERLFAEPYRFEFFQAVRLLERVFAQGVRDQQIAQSASNPEDRSRAARVPVGRVNEAEQVVAPAREVVRFRTRAALHFPPSQLHDLTYDESDERGSPPQMEVAFMGLTGPLGVLPDSYTELLIDRLRAKDRTLYDFLDLFNHRLISFFFRAWEKYRFPVAYERRVVRERNEAERAGQQTLSRTAELALRGRTDDPFTASLFAFIGMGTGGLRRRMSFGDEGLLAYGGVIAQRPRSMSAVTAIIGDYFGVGARIEQFAGQWLQLDAGSVTRLGAANSTLGVNTLAGGRVWDSQSKFRIKLGPLAYGEFKAFLPNGSAFKPVMEMVRFLVGLEFDFDVQLALKAGDVPPSILTTRARRKPMLGWNTWLKTRPFDADDEQVVLTATA
ncbi:MAG: type VI secretion system baseplate subunit TssG [Acidobacteriota bacterium]